MNEPTLHERLRKAEKDGHEIAPEVLTYTYHVPHYMLRAIQTAIEDAATAPLRAENAALRADAQGVKTILESNDHLRAELDRVKQAAVNLSDTCDGWSDSYNALKARSDDLRDAVTLCVQCSSITGLPRALQDYDAADRAGEDTQSGPVDNRASGNSAANCRPGVRAGEASEGTGTPIEREEVASPSPTDAAEGDADLQARPDTERITDLVTRADAATSRLDMHMQRLDDFQRWRGGVDKELVSIRGGMAIDRIEEKEQDDRICQVVNHVQFRLGNVEDKADKLEVALEAARTPVPEVTDAMCEAYQTEMNHQRGETMREHVRRSIAAALALAAGGAK